jgi:hypothetical protein
MWFWDASLSPDSASRLLVRFSFLRQTFLAYESGFLEVDLAEVARENEQVSLGGTGLKGKKKEK